VTEPATIQRPTRALLREGKRHAEESGRLAVDLPPLSAHVTLCIQRAALPNVIHPLTQEVLVVLEHYSRVQDVVDRCSYPDYQVLRTLHTLIRRGMLELRRGADPAAPLAETLLRTGSRRCLRSGRDRPAAQRSAPDAKLLVVASDPGATADFVRMLARLPGVAIDERFSKGSMPPTTLPGWGGSRWRTPESSCCTRRSPRLRAALPLGGHGRWGRSSCWRARRAGPSRACAGR
jgi:hypothetical protein